MKKILSFILVLCMICPMIPLDLVAADIQASEMPYTDIASDNVWRDSILDAYDLDLMRGIGAGLFDYTRMLTHAEAVTIAARIHMMDKNVKDELGEGTPWFADYVDYALENDIITDANINWLRPITMLELAHYLYAALPEDKLEPIEDLEYGSIMGAPVDPAVYTLYSAGVFAGNYFDAEGGIIRGEAADVAVKMVKEPLRTTEPVDDTPPPIRVDTDENGMSSDIGNSANTGDKDNTDNTGNTDNKDDKSEYYDENNALKEPFDIVYSDIFNAEDFPYAKDNLLIKVSSAFSGKVTDDLAGLGVKSLEKSFDVGEFTWYVVYISEGFEVEKVIASLRELDLVKVAEYNYIYESKAIYDGDDISESVISNPSVGDQWYINSAGVQAAWKYLADNELAEAGKGTVVAVIDTGVDYTHEDLVSNMWYNAGEIPENGMDDDGNGYVDDYYGIDLIYGSGSGNDDHGHGTHVAGIIAAANNDIGTVGVAYNTKIMAVKAGQASGYFHNTDIAEAIIYAYENGADVINMSFGGSSIAIAIQDALVTAYNQCVLVAAAGNDGLPNEGLMSLPSYPAALKYVLGVMSVNRYDIESGFTNYDVWANTSYEYEVYAPGEDILSTLPGNKYASWNGTSMATPFVSAMAAIIRSVHTDRDTYPTKYIYGQIVGTGDTTPFCCNPGAHGGHNIPYEVDLYEALTNTPVPDLKYVSYTIFDTVGLCGNEKNNGDGIIDAGETIALGVTIRNIWGQSKDTLVTVDTISPGGVPSQYITIDGGDSSTKNYGTVGTYSETDCGKIIDNDAHVGWQDPFIITVRDDAPNDLSVAIYVTISGKNGLDETDETDYVSDRYQVNLEVRRGVLLPNYVTEDLTLSADNYYIIPNSMTIAESATVTVEAGTQIQFWSNDPHDAYAEIAMTYLEVRGKLICKGTADNHIKMFPSEFRNEYRVEIKENGDGYVELNYCDIVNPYLNVTKAYGCQFTQTYKDDLCYRYYDSGEVKTSSSSMRLYIDSAELCSFYVLGGKYNKAKLYANCKQCVFADSAIEFGIGYVYEDCLFLGNNNYLDNDTEGQVSSIQIDPTFIIQNIEEVIVNEETDRAYAIVRFNNGSNELKLRELNAMLGGLGGSLACFETTAERSFLNNNLNFGDWFMTGLTRDENGELIWCNGVKADISISQNDKDYAFAHSHRTNMSYGFSNYNYYALIELPCDPKIESIGLTREDVILENGTEYQIELTPVPSRVDTSKFIFESNNEAVATVDKNGLVKAIANGEAEIKISSKDRVFYSILKVVVTDYVAITDLKLNAQTTSVLAGDSIMLGTVLYPANATESVITYTSSDTSIATVSRSGKVTTISPGYVTITVTDERTGISDSVELFVYLPLESLAFDAWLYSTTLEKDDKTDFYPELYPANTTECELIWESSNPEVAYVDENGKLVKLKNGITMLSVSVKGTSFSSTLTVNISNGSSEIFVKKFEQYAYDNETYALLDDGSLWIWGGSNEATPQKILDGVKDFSTGIIQLSGAGFGMPCVFSDGTAGIWNSSRNEISLINIKNVKSVSSCTNQSGFDNGAAFLLEDGNVFAVGSNGNHWRFGTENESVYGFVEIEDVVDVVVTDYSAFYLKANGDLYVTGSYLGYKKPVKVESNVDEIVGEYMGENIVLRKGSNLHSYNLRYTNQTLSLQYTAEVIGDFTAIAYGNSVYGYKYYINDGEVYMAGCGPSSVDSYGMLGTGSYGSFTSYRKVVGLDNVTKVFSTYYNNYFQTADGKLYGCGYNNNSQLGMLEADRSCVPVLIPFGIETEGGSDRVLEGQLDQLIYGELINAIGIPDGFTAEAAYDLDEIKADYFDGQYNGSFNVTVKYKDTLSLVQRLAEEGTMYTFEDMSFMLVRDGLAVVFAGEFDLAWLADVSDFENVSEITFAEGVSNVYISTDELPVYGNIKTINLPVSLGQMDERFFDVFESAESCNYAGDLEQWLAIEGTFDPGSDITMGKDNYNALSKYVSEKVVITLAWEKNEGLGSALILADAPASFTFDDTAYDPMGDYAAIRDIFDEFAAMYLEENGSVKCLLDLRRENLLHSTNVTEDETITENELVLDFYTAVSVVNDSAITLRDSTGSLLSFRKEVSLDKIRITRTSGFVDGETYTLTVGTNALRAHFGANNESFSVTFTYNEPVVDTETEADPFEGYFASGTGTEADPYIIETAEQLTALAELVNSGAGTTGKFFKLGNDIYLNDETFERDSETGEIADLSSDSLNEWTPIGSGFYSFRGTFDGDGHMISGLYINSEEEDVPVGLFAEANGPIKNVGIVDSYIKGNDIIGAIAARGNASITNCYNTATIIGGDHSHIGGIVGELGGTAYIGNCYNTGYIYSENVGVGGIAGVTNGDSTIIGIENCYNAGSVTGNAGVGGIIAMPIPRANFITNCYNVGDIYVSYGKRNDFGIIGGFFGEGTTNNCYYLDSSAENTSSDGTPLTEEQMRLAESFVGFDFETVWTIDADAEYPYPTFIVEEADPFEGYFAAGTGTEADPYIIETAEQLTAFAELVNSGADTTGKFFKLGNDIYLNDETFERDSETGEIADLNSDSLNEWTPIGTLKGSFDGDGHVISGLYINSESPMVGLFLSNFDGEIKNLGIVSSYVSNSQTKYVNSFAGAIVASNNGTITNCYNTGKVYSFDSCSQTLSVYAGGIAGYNIDTITGCYSIGEVIASYSEYSTLCITICAGGITGYNREGTITGCYSIGEVIASSEYNAEYNYICAGGIAGSNDKGTVTGCYYLDSSAENGNSYGTPLTEEQMRLAESFVGFDFETVWTIDADSEYPYPTFIVEEAEEEIGRDTAYRVAETVRDENYEIFEWNSTTVKKAIDEEILNRPSYFFHGNAILNRIAEGIVDKWLKINTYEVSTYTAFSLMDNYWGTTNELLIEKQIFDFDDYQNLVDIKYDGYLTSAGENVWPHVTDITILNAEGEEVSLVGNETLTFRVTFNRDMDTTMPLRLRFGSYYPYGDYEISGEFVDARTWEGTTTLKTIIEGGIQYISVDNAASADGLPMFRDWGRFSFNIDTNSVLSMNLQGECTDEGVNLTWVQDDYETLAGYNVYRSTAEDGYYQRLNKTIIPAGENTYFDKDVEPGVVYYYNFRVVLTDLSESEPSGKICIMTRDTMSPAMYHTPVYRAFSGTNLVISTIVTDNVAVQNAKLYFRVTGESEWNSVTMTALNDKYSAIIGASYVTTEGLEYYIEAFDGSTYAYMGSADDPYAVTVQVSVAESDLGDVDGDGKITNRDALMLLQAVNDILNLTAEQFERADINRDGIICTAEAYRILQYVSGSITDVKF